LCRTCGQAPEHSSIYFVKRFGISGRELEVVTCVLGGLANKEIADRLFISPKTVENHLYKIYQKLGINNRVQLYNLLRSDAN
jgi:DNA-binding CsgD family transcriptional regulator